MKTNKTWIFAVIVLGLSAFAIYDYQKTINDEVEKEEKSKIVLIKEEEVELITIERGVEPISMQKTPDGWMLKSPISELADQKAAEEFLKGILSEKFNDVAVEGDKLEWSAFGLDQPKATLVLRTKNKEELKIKISAKKNFQGDSFLRIGEENKVLIASSTWFSKADKKLIDLRDKRILKAPTAVILGLDVSIGKEKYSISLKDSEWLSTSSKNKLGQNKVRELITLIGEIQATEVVSEAEPLPQQAKDWGLRSSPKQELKLSLKDMPQWKASFFQGVAKDWYAQVEGIQKTYRVDAAQMDRLAKFDNDALRDREEPFTFSKNDVREISIDTALKKSRFKMTNERWELIPADANLEVAQEEVKSLISKIRNLQVLQFSSKKTDAKFSKSNRIELFDGVGKPVITIAWLPSQKVKVDGAERLVNEVKSNLFDGVVTVEESSMAGLTLASLTSEKNPQKAETPKGKQ
jgi:hypothetical protein